MFRSVSNSDYVDYINNSRDLFDGCVKDISIIIEHLGEVIGTGMASKKFEVLGIYVSNMVVSLRRRLYDRSLGVDFDPEFAIDLLGSTIGRHWDLVMRNFNALYRVVSKDEFIVESLDALKESLLDLDGVIQGLIDYLNDLIDD